MKQSRSMSEFNRPTDFNRLYPKYYFSKNTMADDNTLIKIEIETQTTESDLIRNKESDGNRCFWLVYSY